MTGNVRILGSLRFADGKGVVHLLDRFDTDIEDLWQALTDPKRLARWYADDVDGDLRPGGEYRARVFASGWEGTGRIEACEPPRRLVVTGKDPDEPYDNVTEVMLTADGDQTIPVIDQRGLPPSSARSSTSGSRPCRPGLLAGDGAGLQIHVEDLAAHIAGARARRHGAVGRAHACLSGPGVRPQLGIPRLGATDRRQRHWHPERAALSYCGARGLMEAGWQPGLHADQLSGTAGRKRGGHGHG